MAIGTLVLWDCQFTVSDWPLDSSGKFRHHIAQSCSHCLRSGRSVTLVWQFHHASSLGSRPIHSFIQYECHRDLFEVGFRLVKDSLVASILSFVLAGLSWFLCLLLMNAEIYSIYEWINGFMGLTLGVIGGLYLLVLLLKRPSLQLAKIYLFFSLGALFLYHYSGFFANSNPWLNSIITTLSALFISILGRLYESKI